jgi:hypothetical protein
MAASTSGPCDDPIIRDSGCQTTRASTEDEASDVTDANGCSRRQD